MPCRLTFTDVVIITPEKAKTHRIKGKISLRSRLRDQSLISRQTIGVSHGNEIDAIIKKYKGHYKQQSIAGLNSGQRLLKILALGRIDWFIYDPLSITFFFKAEGLNDAIKFYQIQELRNPFLLGYIVAPKNQWGKSKIESIDALLKTLLFSEDVYQKFVKWIPEEPKPLYKKGYGALILEPAETY